METLELKHLAVYLPYGTNVLFEYKASFKCDPNYITIEKLHPSNIFIIGKKTYSVVSSKPILRPLSDLTKEIEVNGEKFVPIAEIGKLLGFDYLTPFEIDENEIQYGWDSRGMDDSQGYVFGFSNELKTFGVWYDEQEGNPIYLSGGYDEIQKLIEWHFDIFGLIEAGLAIDINTLEK
jgi:hypothetical protein